MRRIVSVVIVAVLVGGGVWGYFYAQSRGNVPKYRMVRVERGPLTAAVSAMGNLNAVITVQVGSQVSGQIKELRVDFNSIVKKNQVIARIDQDIFVAKVNQAQADLDSAKATHDSAIAQVDSAKAHELALDSAIQSATAQLRVAQAMLVSARAQVQQKNAGLKQRHVDRDHTTILAHVEAVVGSRHVYVGQTVSASLQAPIL